MYELLEINSIKWYLIVCVILQKDSTFSLIADVILEGLEVDLVESYFITKSFYRFSEEISNELPKLKQQTFYYLEKEEDEIFRYESVLINFIRH